jgi:hypothetical protein
MKRKMESLNILRYLCLLFVFAFGFATIVATGGGGGGGGGGTPSSSSGTGSVALMLADGPADLYDEIWITIEKAYLIPVNGPPVLIFEGPITRDLLKLRDDDFLLTLKDDVPAGLYAKIRLEVSNISPVGGPCPSFNVKLPSGKIDLNPQHPFKVVSGATVFIRLDMDANKSINLHPAGQSGKCIFRPVVFVDITYGQPPRPCPQVFNGRIVKFFDRDSDGQIDGFLLELSENRGELKVLLSQQVRIFDYQGLPTDASFLGLNQLVNVRGKMANNVLLASVVVQGQVYFVKGTVEGIVVNDLFPFTPDLQAGIVVDPNGQIDVELVRDNTEVKTVISIGCDNEVGPSAIQPGMGARIVYKLVCSSGSCVLRAVAVLLKPMEISGQLNSWYLGAGGKQLVLDVGGTTIHVPLNETVSPSIFPVYLENDGLVSLSLLCKDPVEPVRRQVRVILDPDVPSPLTATEVRVQSEPVDGLSGTVQDVTNAPVLDIDGQLVQVQSGAVIVDLSNNRPVSINDIQTGDDVVYYGLQACSTNDNVNFYAFIMLIEQ